MQKRVPDMVIRLIINALPAMVGYVNRDLIACFLNDAYSEWCATPKAKLEGCHVREVLGEADFSQALPHMMAALAGERREHVRVATGPTGERRVLLASYVPHEIEGEVLGIFTLVQDVTGVQQDLLLDPQNKVA